MFLISLKAGGLGLHLTAADYIFLLDPWWNPAVESQAIDRAHRIGQTRPVFACRLIARDTVEEKRKRCSNSRRKNGPWPTPFSPRTTASSETLAAMTWNCSSRELRGSREPCATGRLPLRRNSVGSIECTSRGCLAAAVAAVTLFKTARSGGAYQQSPS